MVLGRTGKTPRRIDTVKVGLAALALAGCTAHTDTIPIANDQPRTTTTNYPVPTPTTTQVLCGTMFAPNCW